MGSSRQVMDIKYEETMMGSRDRLIRRIDPLESEKNIKIELAKFADTLNEGLNDYPIKIQKMLTHIHQNIFEPTLSVEQLKIMCGYANNNVVSAFRKNVGVGPGEYIRNLKIRAASSVLRNGYVNIYRLAALIHYSHEGLSRIFKECHGCTPMQYCQNVTNPPPRA